MSLSMYDDDESQAPLTLFRSEAMDIKSNLHNLWKCCDPRRLEDDDDDDDDDSMMHLVPATISTSHSFGPISPMAPETGFMDVFTKPNSSPKVSVLMAGKYSPSSSHSSLNMPDDQEISHPSSDDCVSSTFADSNNSPQKENIPNRTKNSIVNIGFLAVVLCLLCFSFMNEFPLVMEEHHLDNRLFASSDVTDVDAPETTSHLEVNAMRHDEPKPFTIRTLMAMLKQKLPPDHSNGKKIKKSTEGVWWSGLFRMPKLIEDKIHWIIPLAIGGLAPGMNWVLYTAIAARLLCIGVLD